MNHHSKTLKKNRPQAGHYNPPYLNELAYRIDTHPTFLRRMLARLPLQASPDGPNKGKRPLAALTTRDRDDPTIALIDAWAVVADVLTFYQERIFNEGYLRTANERRSVLELARAIGYELSPGLAASAYLAFTVEDAPGAPGVATVPKGTRVQSIPGQGKLPQTFETLEEIEARAEFNVLKPYQFSQVETQGIGWSTNALYLDGINTGLQPGDAILITGDERETEPQSDSWYFLTLQDVIPEPEKNRTFVTWGRELKEEKDIRPPSNPKVFAFRQRAGLFGSNAPDWSTLDDSIKIRYISGDFNDEIFSIAFSPANPQWCISGSADGVVRLWNMVTETEIRTFKGHSGAVNSVAFSPDGKGILSGSDDGTIKLWDVDTGADIRTFTGHTGAVKGVAFSPNGEQFVSGGADRIVRVWNVDEGYVIRQFTEHTDTVTSVAFSPTSSQHVLSGSADGTVRLFWNVEGRGQIALFTGHTSAVNSVAFSPDGEQVLSGSADRTLRLWSVASKTGIRTFTGHTGAVNSVAFSPDGKRVLSGGADGTVRLWNVDTGAEIRTYVGHTGSVNSVAVADSPDGLVVLSGSSDKRLKLWSVETGINIHSFGGPPPMDEFPEWPNFRTRGNQIDLDATYIRILKGSWVVLMNQAGAEAYVELCKATNVLTVTRADFALTGRITRILPDTQVDPEKFGLRDTLVFAGSEGLALYEEEIPLRTPVQGKEIVLERLVEGLPGRTVIVSGNIHPAAQADEIVSEVALIQGVKEDQGRTTIVLGENLQNSYDPATVAINANVARATHGETVTEVLGSGDGTQTNQRFELKKPPLTYLPAPTPTGAESALEVRVNGVLWGEAPSLYGLDASHQSYEVRLDDDGRTRVTFGDGQSGARLPSGTDNVVATYRSGIGPDGEVEAGSLSLLQTRPLGIRGVTNPLPADGAAPPETLELARANAPVAMLTLDRLVSLKDFENFASAFNGIGKAQALAMWNGEATVVHITVAGLGGEEVPAVSPLHESLTGAFDALKDPIQQVEVGSYDPQRFNLEAKVRVDPRYVSDAVLANVETALGEAFAFEKRDFGQSVTTSEVISIIQAVPGVVAVDLDYLYNAIEGSPKTPPEPRILAEKAGWDAASGKILPAQLLLLDKVKLTKWS